MTRSASTPRLRLTLLYFLLLIGAAGFIEPTGFLANGGAGGLWRIVSLLLVATACLGRIWCSVFVAGRKDAVLVTTGPYALVRHPLYVLSFLGGLGLGLATGSVALTTLTLAILALLFRSAAVAEERVLESLHGAAFASYTARTPRWWPKWSSWNIPDRVDVQAKVLWKAFVDAGAFFLVYAFLLAAIELRAAGILPTLLRLA